MDNTITALQNLYTALGGDADTVADLVTIPEMINAIAALISGGGAAELPEVGAADNGKVLTVVDGAWAAANLPAET